MKFEIQILLRTYISYDVIIVVRKTTVNKLSGSVVCHELNFLFNPKSGLISALCICDLRDSNSKLKLELTLKILTTTYAVPDIDGDNHNLCMKTEIHFCAILACGVGIGLRFIEEIASKWRYSLLLFLVAYLSNTRQNLENNLFLKKTL